MNIFSVRYLSVFIVSILVNFVFVTSTLSDVLSGEKFTQNDAVLVVDSNNQIVYEWRADELMIPASLAKIITSYLAIRKWHLAHQFKTEFYFEGSQLWVKGYGDPYLVSEEIDDIVLKLQEHDDLDSVQSIHIDNNYFAVSEVPGSSSASDPYNAPVSAVSANFNTVSLKKKGGELISGEQQTPLTELAKKLASNQSNIIDSQKPTRINLISVSNSQQQFAEILASKLGLNNVAIRISQTLPETANLFYQHQNSNSLETVLAGTMKYSNNFIANQVFIKLAEEQVLPPLNFEEAQAYAKDMLKREFSWSQFHLDDGAGLSRKSKVSARQLNDVLFNLRKQYYLFNKVMFEKELSVIAYVKTGTLNGVSNYAGYLNTPKEQYRFVFMFNRSTPYRYRNALLEQLAQELFRLESL